MRKLRQGKAAGGDAVPPDFWKALTDDEDACLELLELCQHCWDKRALPPSWQCATVVLLFKKGDASLPQNYRPISLLPVGYKVLASLTHQRMIAGGTEARIRASQYGFRPGMGTADALMVVRRMIDAAHQSNNNPLVLVLLDWAKAFDRIKIKCMLSALTRFGLPREYVDMIHGIYSERSFLIHDHTGTSSLRRQESGIAQGCPLSPYLFIIMQTVMLHDVYRDVRLEEEPEFVVTRDILYADDTLLMSSSTGNLQKLLDAIVAEGLLYGLEMNWAKTQQLRVSTQACVVRPDGAEIKCVREAVYLGSLITCDGKGGRELSRRIGEGRRTLDGLERVWRHAGVTRTRQMEIYMAYVVSKLMYSLDTIWLLKN